MRKVERRVSMNKKLTLIGRIKRMQIAYAMRTNGYTFAEIGELLAVSKARAWQLYRASYSLASRERLVNQIEKRGTSIPQLHD